MKTVAIHNLGCKVNSYEAESMEQLLVQAGYGIVPFSEEVSADVYIINTCSVTNIADRKSRQMLHKAKKMNPEAVVIAAGCYVQADSEKASEDTAVDIILGNNCKINIVDVLENYFRDSANNSCVVDISKNQQYENLNIDKVSEHTRAYIKIQDGCNQFCSYCIIPYTRGRIRSRSLEDIVAEVRKLALNGYKEIVLTGIHLSSYGLEKKVPNGDYLAQSTAVENVGLNNVQDMGNASVNVTVAEEKNVSVSEENNTLLDVIKAVNEIDGIERIRLGSLEPRIITDEFVSAISSMEKMCPHFHLSLQSGCDTVLKRMNRKYNTEEYYEKCELLRKYFDNPAITTDVIVGFPGETDEEFEATKTFLDKVHFAEMHIFKYSRRKGTVADKMPNQVADSIKTIRSNELLKLENAMANEYKEQFADKEMSVLLEEQREVNGVKCYSGYTKNYIRVNVPCDEFDGNKVNLVNEFVQVRMKELSSETGEMTGEAYCI